MKEIYEFRVLEKYAGLIFGPNEGKKLGRTKLFGDEFVTVRKVLLSADNPKFKRVGELNALIRKEHNELFFFGWDIKRLYTAEELAQAELFLFFPATTFEPSGKACGTQYDPTSACPICKSGAKQISPLFLDWNRIPKSKDIAGTIHDEIVVSKRMVDLLDRNSITGAEFGPVGHHPASSAKSKDWFQLLVKTCNAEITVPTKIGIGPFDEDIAGKERCPLGDLIGLNLLSEVYIRRSSYIGLDIVASRQFVGTSRLRPRQLMLVSPKFRQTIIKANLKGCKFEIVHLV
jgi:hypothetical protein